MKNNLLPKCSKYAHNCLDSELGRDMISIGLSALYEMKGALSGRLDYAAIRGSVSRCDPQIDDDVDLLISGDLSPDGKDEKMIKEVCLEYGNKLKLLEPQMKRIDRNLLTCITMTPEQYGIYRNDPISLDLSCADPYISNSKPLFSVISITGQILEKEGIMTDPGIDVLDFLNNRIFSQLVWGVMPLNVKRHWNMMSPKRREKLRSKYSKEINHALIYTVSRLTHLNYHGGEDFMNHDVIRDRNKIILSEFPDGALKKY
jgi:hypothetical protein